MPTINERCQYSVSFVGNTFTGTTPNPNSAQGMQSLSVRVFWGWGDFRPPQLFLFFVASRTL